MVNEIYYQNGVCDPSLAYTPAEEDGVAVLQSIDPSAKAAESASRLRRLLAGTALAAVGAATGQPEIVAVGAVAAGCGTSVGANPRADDAQTPDSSSDLTADNKDAKQDRGAKGLADAGNDSGADAETGPAFSLHLASINSDGTPMTGDSRACAVSSGERPTIAFLKGGEVYVWRRESDDESDPGAATRVGASFDDEASWIEISADARYVAYPVFLSGIRQVVRNDLGEDRLVVVGPENTETPYFSMDDSGEVFALNTGGRFPAAVIKNMETGSEEQAATYTFGPLALSGDGNRVAYVNDPGDIAVKVYDRTAEEEIFSDTIGDSLLFDLNGDGTVLPFVGPDGLMWADLIPEERRERIGETPSGEPAPGLYFSPGTDAGGNRLAFASSAAGLTLEPVPTEELNVYVRHEGETFWISNNGERTGGSNPRISADRNNLCLIGKGLVPADPGVSNQTYGTRLNSLGSTGK